MKPAISPTMTNNALSGGRMKKILLFGCLGAVILIVILALWLFSSYNSMVKLDQGVKAQWSQVENQYQRRMDLIPNLVETVKGYAAHEKETLTQVVEARAKAGGVLKAGENALSSPEAFKRMEEAQNSLTGALSRLMVVVERYPDLKANQNFLTLQSQLEGTENRITVERMRFNETAQGYNTYIKRIPQVLFARLFGFSERSYFAAQTGAEQAPKVDFGTTK
jgi:LemA protein